MADLDLWITGWALGGAAVVIAALLLIAILVTAYGIEKQAARALDALRRIEGNTKPIWILGRTAKRFNAFRDYFEELEDRSAQLAAAAHGEDTGRRER